MLYTIGFTRKSIVLLCAEPTPEKCHRRLLAELIADANPAIKVRHILREAGG